MVDFVDQTLMAAAPEFWGRGQVIHDERLERVLGVDEFRMPLSADEYAIGLPFVRFPEWYFCPSCRRFKSIQEWEVEYKEKNQPNRNRDINEMTVPKCLECKGHPQLVPARIISLCEHGHIQDFPWIEWTHYKDKKPICEKPQLKITTGASSAGLEGIKLECKCSAKTTMKGSFGDDVFSAIVKELEKQGNDALASKFKCRGKVPWRGKSEKCPDPTSMRTAQRGASNVYFSKVESSIVIPPYSDEITVKIEESSFFDKMIDALNRATRRNRKEQFLKEEIDEYVVDISKEIHVEVSIVRKIVKRKLDKPKDIDINEFMTKNKYKAEEYMALNGEIPLVAMNGRDFVIQEMNVDDYKIPQISKVVLVKKMREVRVLTGFTRLNPPDQNIICSDEGDRIEQKSLIVSVKKRETNWYPAYEVRGEGIFIEFDESMLEKWSQNEDVQYRASLINEKYQTMILKRGYSKRQITPKFLFLHTLAHLLMRQLSFDCGYSSASLRERIYCNDPDEDFKMSGILIYTASGDSEGTLGGLVRQGHPDNLPRVLYSALRNARWCSSDPVCIESKGQGRESMNLSACHACTLVSETSCEEFNVLLDRGLVLGTLRDGDIGFFSNLV